MRTEGDDILADYATREANRARGRFTGIEFGIPELDAKIDGLQNGELALIVGYTSDGKSSACVQLAWHAAIRQRRNVVVLTTETLRDQIRRRVIARHSCLPEFGIHPITDAVCRGLNSRDIKKGTLTVEEKGALQRVVTDFTSNPGYGRCYLVQVPRGATVGYCESKLVRIQRMFQIDLVIMDYLALLKPERRRSSVREELSNILQEAKQVATTFDGGRGVPVVSPWQVTRESRREATRLGYYSSSAITSETAEASNTPDLLITMLAPEDNDARVANIRFQVMKNRDGERSAGINVTADSATCRFAAATERVPSSLDHQFVDLGTLV